MSKINLSSGKRGAVGRVLDYSTEGGGSSPGVFGAAAAEFAEFDLA